MLYISTRSKVDSYTAHRAFYEEKTGDGGFYVPFRLSVPENKLFDMLKKQTAGETIAAVLNHFFGFGLTGWDIDCAIGRTPFQPIGVNRRITVAECWHNPGQSWEYIIKNLYTRMGGGEAADCPQGWVRVAIEIAILFGIYVQMDLAEDTGFDICVTGGNFATVSAALYAKDLGLPIGKILCVCNENGFFWDLVYRGEMNTGATIAKTDLPVLDTARPKYLEYLLHRTLGTDAVSQYLDVCNQNGVFHLDEESRILLEREVSATVASSSRMDAVISSIYRSNGYIADPELALCYGGLQDYRASSGVSNHTLLLAKKSPALSANRITGTLGISQSELTKQIKSPKE